MANDTVLNMKPLGTPWATLDPFLFCVHHDDAYPKGNAELGPDAPLTGRNIGEDFEGIDGWRMYHCDVVPGFPQHPHRGFETVTVVRRGLIDHSDSLGATARFGKGDTQWLTAGKGIVHSEMFPLVDRAHPNPLELFQIWLNLPKRSKMVDPYFSMLWNKSIPIKTFSDDNGRKTNIIITAGDLEEAKAPKPPPDSWASNPESDLAIWTLQLEPNARWVVPPARHGTNRMLYFFAGQSLKMAGQDVPLNTGVSVRADHEVELVNGAAASELLMLQGQPLREPVVQYGPFVMNTRAEIQQAFADYERTQFGGWPWPSNGPAHARDEGRFARHADGRVEKVD